MDIIGNVNAATTIVTMHGDYAITANFTLDWLLIAVSVGAVVAAGLAFFSCVEGELLGQKGRVEEELPGKNAELRFQPLLPPLLSTVFMEAIISPSEK